MGLEELSESDSAWLSVSRWPLEFLSVSRWPLEFLSVSRSPLELLLLLESLSLLESALPGRRLWSEELFRFHQLQYQLKRHWQRRHRLGWRMFHLSDRST